MYSSFFGGGKNAYKKAIMENTRKDLGLQEAKFQEYSEYHKYLEQAEEIGEILMTSDTVADFRKVAEAFTNQYADKICVGPTGWTQQVDIQNVQNTYSTYLQDFERALKCEFAVRAKKTFPDFELLLDLHDGIFVAVPTDKSSDFEKFVNNSVTEIGQQLGLLHPQVMEISATFNTSSDNILTEYNVGNVGFIEIQAYPE